MSTPARPRIGSLGFVGVAAFTLAACGAEDPSADTAPSASTPPVETTIPDGGPDEETAGDPVGDWIATSAESGGVTVGLLPGWDVSMSIAGDEITGTAACNGYGGTVAIGDDGSFSVGEVAMTEMGCQPDVQALEQAFAAALFEFDAYVVDGGTLTLSGGGHEWTFERLAPIDDTAIVGTTWVLDTYVSGDAATTMPGMDDATLTMNADGTFTGSTGCRDLAGEWIEAGGEIVFTSFGADGECPPELRELDNWVVTVLGDGFRPTVEGDRLTLTSAGGEGLSYTTG